MRSQRGGPRPLIIDAERHGPAVNVREVEPIPALEATDAFWRVSARVAADRAHGAALLVLALDDAAVVGPLGAGLPAIRRQLDERFPPAA